MHELVVGASYELLVAKSSSYPAAFRLRLARDAGARTLLDTDKLVFTADASVMRASVEVFDEGALGRSVSGLFDTCCAAVPAASGLWIPYAISINANVVPGVPWVAVGPVATLVFVCALVMAFIMRWRPSNTR